MSNFIKDFNKLQAKRRREERHQRGEYNFFEVLIMFMVVFLLLDVMFFILWTASCQVPVDNFHAGIISESIIRLIIK